MQGPFQRQPNNSNRRPTHRSESDDSSKPTSSSHSNCLNISKREDHSSAPYEWIRPPKLVAWARDAKNNTAWLPPPSSRSHPHTRSTLAPTISHPTHAMRPGHLPFAVHPHEYDAHDARERRSRTLCRSISDRRCWSMSTYTAPHKALTRPLLTELGLI